MLTQAAAAAKGGATAHAAKPDKVTKQHPRQKARKPARPLSLEQRIARLERSAHRCRSTIRFFENHPRLLRSPRQRPKARAALRRAHRELASTQQALDRVHRAVARREARRLAKAPPEKAICHVFGRRYCREALDVSWCESRHSTTAQNGQYLGLFQMGAWEREVFGHGPTALKQALAAHKYFVLTDRDWSPWSCKPSYGF